MGNTIGRGKKAKVMKINGETIKFKTPTMARDVVRDYPGYVLLDSDAVKYFGVRAKPLEPHQELKPRKIYFLVELPKFPDEEKNTNNIKQGPITRRVQSGVHMSAKDRLELLMLSRRSVSELTVVRSVLNDSNNNNNISMGEGPNGPVRVKVRLPKAQVENLMKESRDGSEVAERIIDLYLDKSGHETNSGIGRHHEHLPWKPELGSVKESLNPRHEKRVNFAPDDRQIQLLAATSH